MNIRRTIIVHGLVQGVSFRKQSQQAARQLGVNGWVRNRSDGTVEACLEGSETAVAALIAWCHAGPKNGIVTDVRVTDSGDPEGHDDFVIREDHTAA